MLAPPDSDDDDEVANVLQWRPTCASRPLICRRQAGTLADIPGWHRYHHWSHCHHHHISPSANKFCLSIHQPTFIYFLLKIFICASTRYYCTETQACWFLLILRRTSLRIGTILALRRCWSEAVAQQCVSHSSVQQRPLDNSPPLSPAAPRAALVRARRRGMWG